MKITFLLHGKTTEDYLLKAMEAYEKRLKHYTRFEVLTIPALKDTKNLPPAEVKNREGALLLERLRTDDILVLLDEKGKSYTSVEYANHLQKLMNQGKDIVFAVGGAYGFAEAVHNRANGKLSLSPMTMSHQLVRPVFMEQLYRAFTILKGEPYHNE